MRGTAVAAAGKVLSQTERDLSVCDDAVVCPELENREKLTHHRSRYGHVT